ncbi:MAG: flagellin [Opitutae bacterium]|nr:flagellin [Opitutae bacterium]
MPIVVNSNTSATSASFNLSRANDSLRQSLSRLSSGKRINSPADDAGGLAVAYKLESKLNRTEAVVQNSQNALSFLQVQDGALATVGKVLDRMGELRTMAQDITKNSGDIENYSKEFLELQSQLNQVKQSKFNGISLFSVSGETLQNDGDNSPGGGSYTDVNGTTVSYDKYGHTLYTAASGQPEDGSISVNVVNLQFVLSIGNLSGTTNTAGSDLGGFDNAVGAGITGTATDTARFISSILDVSVGQFTEAIERLADMRAENGAEQNRVMNSIELLQTNLTNLEAAHGRIMDADIALESTRFARHNVLVQASAAMTAQANQLTNVALQLLG